MQKIFLLFLAGFSIQVTYSANRATFHVVRESTTATVSTVVVGGSGQGGRCLALALVRVPDQDDVDFQSRAPYILQDPYTTPLDSALRMNLLRECPKRIITLINCLNQRSGEGATLDEKEKFYRRMPKKCLLVGPKRSGKSTLVQAIAGECNMPFFMYEASAMHKGCRNEILKKIFADAAALNAPCILAISGLEEFFCEDRFETRDTSFLRWQLDFYKEFPILFIGTVNDLSNVPPNTWDRFRACISEIPPLNASQRETIISFHMRNLCHNVDVPLAKELAQKTEDYSHRRLEQLVQIANAQCHNLSPETYRSPTRDDFIEVLNRGAYVNKQTFWDKILAKAKEWVIPVTCVCIVAGGLLLGYSCYKHKLVPH